MKFVKDSKLNRRTPVQSHKCEVKPSFSPHTHKKRISVPLSFLQQKNKNRSASTTNAQARLLKAACGRSPQKSTGLVNKTRVNTQCPRNHKISDDDEHGRDAERTKQSKSPPCHNQSTRNASNTLINRTQIQSGASRSNKSLSGSSRNLTSSHLKSSEGRTQVHVNSSASDVSSRKVTTTSAPKTPATARKAAQVESPSTASETQTTTVAAPAAKIANSNTAPRRKPKHRGPSKLQQLADRVTALEEAAKAAQSVIQQAAAIKGKQRHIAKKKRKHKNRYEFRPATGSTVRKELAIAANAATEAAKLAKPAEEPDRDKSFKGSPETGEFSQVFRGQIRLIEERETAEKQEAEAGQDIPKQRAKPPGIAQLFTVDKGIVQPNSRTVVAGEQPESDYSKAGYTFRGSNRDLQLDWVNSKAYWRKSSAEKRAIREGKKEIILRTIPRKSKDIPSVSISK